MDCQLLHAVLPCSVALIPTLLVGASLAGLSGIEGGSEWIQDVSGHVTSIKSRFRIGLQRESRQECLLYWSRTDIPVCSAGRQILNLL